MSTSAWFQIAELVAVDGPAAHEAAIRSVVLDARARACAPVLREILGDTGAPVIVRQRALGRLIGVLRRADAADALDPVSGHEALPASEAPGESGATADVVLVESAVACCAAAHVPAVGDAVRRECAPVGQSG